MNWVGGARSRVKQSQERKIQKEFFARQKLAKKVNIHRQLSPKGHKKPISLDLLSLQTINQTHQGENGVRKQPVKIVLGDRSNLLSRRQEDLELPMSPIRNPSSLVLLDSKSDMDRHIPYQLQKPSHDEQGTGSKLSLPIAGNRGKHSNHIEYSDALPTSSRNINNNDESLLSESFLSFYNPQQQQLLSSEHQKAIKQPAQGEGLKHDQCLPLPKKDLLAFQRAEKEKYMSLKPLEVKLPFQARACTASITTNSNMKCRDNLVVDNESAIVSIPTIGLPLKSAAASYVTSTSEKSTVKSNASNDGLNDAERKVLLGLDYDKEQDTNDTASHGVPAKKAKISSFEEMISNYEMSVISKKKSKPVTNGNHDAWRKFTHEKSSPKDDVCKVPDIEEPPAAERKASLFFKQKLPKKSIASMKRPPTVLQELLCLDEDLNNSDLFQTQDFTFDDALAVDFEEPLKNFEHYTANLKGIKQITDDNKTVSNNDVVIPTEEVKILDELDHKELQRQLPKGKLSNGSISVGIQCSSKIASVGTQTKQDPLVKHSSTQSDTIQLVDTGVQATVTNNCSVTTQTDVLLDDKYLIGHQPTSYPDDLAAAQSTIVWQSLMIKALKINANTPYHK